MPLVAEGARTCMSVRALVRIHTKHAKFIVSHF